MSTATLEIAADLLEADAALAEMTRRLVDEFHPDYVYLFGSRARGDYHEDSDYDLMVVVPDDASPQRQQSGLAYEALRGTGTATDVLVCTRSYFDARRHLKASLPGNDSARGTAPPCRIDVGARRRYKGMAGKSCGRH